MAALLYPYVMKRSLPLAFAALLLATQPGLAGQPAAMVAPPASPDMAVALASWTPASAAGLLQVIEAAAAEGLDPADYKAAELSAAIASGDFLGLSSVATSAYFALARDYARGRTPAAARHSWHVTAPRADDAFLQARLSDALANGTVRRSLETLLPDHDDYRALRAALATTADADARATLRVNLDRWRWMPRLLGPDHILVNVPAFEMRLVQGGAVAARKRVIVGKVKTPTIQFSSVMTGIVLNPPWVVPQSIIAESVGSLVRNRPSTARARGYTWTYTGGRLNVTQMPGPGNSLGQVKFDMPNRHAIFMHDTPSKALFDRDVRAFSHGCIRTQGIVDLSAILLETVPGWDRARIDSVLAERKTTRVPLPQQLPVHIAYFTATPGESGDILFHRDLYGRDKPVRDALGAPGTGESARSSTMSAQAPTIVAGSECQAAMPNLPA